MLKSNIKRTSTMMKRLFPTALAVLLLLLAGCTAKPDTSNQSKPAEYYLTDTDLPLDDAAPCFHGAFSGSWAEAPEE